MVFSTEELSINQLCGLILILIKIFECTKPCKSFFLFKLLAFMKTTAGDTDKGLCLRFLCYGMTTLCLGILHLPHLKQAIQDLLKASPPLSKLSI